MITTRTQIIFDLNEEKLKQHYPKGNNQSEDFYKNAYSDIESFMLENGFSRRPYTIYVSENKLSDDKVDELLRELIRKMPWIRYCVDDVEVMELGPEYSIKDAVIALCNEAQEEIVLDKDRKEFKNTHE